MVKQDLKIQPVSDNILVRPMPLETKTASGIILPDTSKEKPQIGEIVAVGPGKVNEDGKKLPMNFKVGQKVIYKKWGGSETKVGTEEWLIIEQSDILAIVS